jgi:sortase A
LDELGNEPFGYIEIPAMNLTLPLYSGASTENLAKGAAILGETSIPVGGIHTNSVIAGHRGYDGKAFFKEIEKIQKGDKVYITNPWGKLTYVACDMNIIEPDDVDAVKIQEGKDMITLMTCHPYASGGKYRYVVYCIRESETLDDENAEMQEPSVTSISNGLSSILSEREIYVESLFRKICMGTGIILLVVSCIGIRMWKGTYRKKSDKKGDIN